MPLSVAIVCKNNESTIWRTLESVVGLADEIVAVDSGSTDGTIGLLERYRARVIRSAWLGHVRTKQMALDACVGDWVLCLDSDESVDEALAASIRRVMAEDDAVVAAGAVNRKVYYRDRALNHAWQPEWRVRLVRRGRYRWGGLDPHDAMEPVAGERGREVRLAGTLRHDSISTFAEFLSKQAGHSRIMAESLHRTGRRGSFVRMMMSPTGSFFKQIVLKQAWRDGWPGWLAAASSAAGALMKHAILIELGRGGSASGSGSLEANPEPTARADPLETAAAKTAATRGM